MKLGTLKLVILAFGLSIAGQQLSAEEAGWSYSGSGAAQDMLLTYRSKDVPTYRFQCASDDVIVTQTSVTELMDFATGEQVDEGATILPEGAAMMALFTGAGQPDFLPADAVKNPKGGWDLSLRFKKRDKRLRAIGKSKMLSLFTSGYTMAVTMDDTSRGVWREFLKDCRSSD